MAIPDQKAKVTVVLELTKDFLTHLEKTSFSPDILPLELFDDFVAENESIKKDIIERKERKRSNFYISN